MGRSSKSISLVLIGPALLGSTILVSGCAPMQDEEVAQEEVIQDDWVASSEDGQDGDYWGPPGQETHPTHHAGGTTHSGHRSNVGGLIGGFLGARAASSASRGGVSSAPSGGPSRVGPSPRVSTPSSRGGFGSSAGHMSSSS